MNKILKEKINEALSSVIPITIIVILLSIVLVPIPVGTVMMFFFGALLLIVGMGFFSLGADIAMMPMGEGIGIEFTKTKKLWLIIILIFSMGVLITVAEPDLQVLARQFPAIPSNMLIGAIAVGVGFFLVAGILRILFRWSLSKMLMLFYAIVFAVSMFVPKEFIAVAFDSGGVTTGPITVPFIMALGLGLSSIRSDKNSQEDSFGLVALSSVGPILAVLILSMGFSDSDVGYTPSSIPDVQTTRDVTLEFLHHFPDYIMEVFTALLPIVLFFIVFQIITRRYKKRQLAKIGMGFIYTLIGLILFLTGANVGFLPMGYLIGFEIAASGFKWFLIPIGMLIGYFIVAAEPAVHVLNKQVEQISEGAIPAKTIGHTLSIGVSLSVGLSILRILTGLNLFWFLIPGYAIALALTFFVPKIFTGIAFDSGGVATGPMTSTFLLPFAIGTCVAVGGDVMTDAFGAVAMIAMIPLIAIQVLGIVYGNNMKLAKSEADGAQDVPDDEILDYDEIVDYYDDVRR